MFKVFRKKDCPECEKLSGLLDVRYKEVKELEVLDIETPEGVAQAAFYDVWMTPSLVYQLVGDEKPRIVTGADSIFEILTIVRSSK
jgi:hypothetical protein